MLIDPEWKFGSTPVKSYREGVKTDLRREVDKDGEFIVLKSTIGSDTYEFVIRRVDKGIYQGSFLDMFLEHHSSLSPDRECDYGLVYNKDGTKATWRGRDLNNLQFDTPGYGVADNIDQVLKFSSRIVNDPNRLFVLTYDEITKDSQPAQGGWRWHKWGRYIGEQIPTCEYIKDEDKIERVICWHFHPVLAKA